MDLQSFRKRVRRDYYQRHKYWFAGAAGGILGAIAFATPYFIVLSGVSLIGSGVAAIRGGKSAVTHIGVGASGDSSGMGWTTRELEEMAPEERANHARLTGSFLILMGTGFLAMIGYYGGTQFRDYRADKRYQAMASAASLVHRTAPDGRGLAASSREVCWGSYQAVAMCSDASLGEAPRIRSDFFQAHELVHTPRGFVLASDREVIWLASIGTSAGVVRFTERLHASGAKALTALGTRVAWVSNGDVIMANLESEQPLESPRVVAKVAGTEPALLALSTDTVLYGPTQDCALARRGGDACAVPRGWSLCAAGSSRTQLVLVTSSGELWRAAAGSGAAFTRVASGLAGCLLALNDRFAFVAGAGPIARVDLESGSQAIIFEADRAAALALSDQRLYFRTAEGIHGIRLDAPPL